MFGFKTKVSNDEVTQLLQTIQKLKQYVDASVVVAETKGSGINRFAHEEACVWKNDLGREIDEITHV
jgi:hypothetical protein